MSDTKLFASENLQTIVVVTFVLLVISLGFNFYNYQLIQQSMVVTAVSDNVKADQLRTEIAGVETKIAAVTEKLTVMDKRVAELAAAAEAADAAAAD